METRIQVFHKNPENFNFFKTIDTINIDAKIEAFTVTMEGPDGISNSKEI